MEKFDPKPSEVEFATVCFRDNFRPEVATDVLSGVAVEWLGADGPVKFGDSRLNHS